MHCMDATYEVKLSDGRTLHIGDDSYQAGHSPFTGPGTTARLQTTPEPSPTVLRERGS
jgi:hypothetical protein